jgi:hypothetical protein
MPCRAMSCHRECPCRTFCKAFVRADIGCTFDLGDDLGRFGSVSLVYVLSRGIACSSQLYELSNHHNTHYLGFLRPRTRPRFRFRRRADYTVKGGKQVRYIPAKMSVTYLHHVKEHEKLHIVH